MHALPRPGPSGPNTASAVLAVHFLQEAVERERVPRELMCSRWPGGCCRDAVRACDESGHVRRYIENALELLDAPNEFYFEPASSTLYLCHNGTGKPPSAGLVASKLQVMSRAAALCVDRHCCRAPALQRLDARFQWLAAALHVVVGVCVCATILASCKLSAFSCELKAVHRLGGGLQTLLELKGTQAAPVQGVSVTGIGFRDAAQSFMGPHGVPSCGDWALQVGFDVHAVNPCAAHGTHRALTVTRQSTRHMAPTARKAHTVWLLRTMRHLQRAAGIFVEGSEDFAVEACSFTRMDGNGLMLSRCS